MSGRTSRRRKVDEISTAAKGKGKGSPARVVVEESDEETARPAKIQRTESVSSNESATSEETELRRRLEEEAQNQEGEEESAEPADKAPVPAKHADDDEQVDYEEEPVVDRKAE